MEKPIDNFWQLRLAAVKAALEANNFEVFLAENEAGANKMVLQDLIPQLKPRTVSWGGSMTFTGSGLYQQLKGQTDLEVWDPFDKKISDDEKKRRRRQALHADLFMIGNRIAALTFGPHWVIIMVGRNKIVPDLEEAMFRVKNYVAPANAMRLDKKTPCVKTSYCQECQSPDRICNTWTITEKAFPKGRVKIVLINQDLGL